MSDQRLPKQLLYGELKTGKRPQGRPRKRYKDEVRVSLSKFRLPDLREAGERSRWRTLLHQGSRIAENDRSEEICISKSKKLHSALQVNYFFFFVGNCLLKPVSKFGCKRKTLRTKLHEILNYVVPSTEKIELQKLKNRH